ncbi:unnamed protein product [Oreochromis niloticus]|nr:unnamed protein product [Mustela putorius furo]
MDNKMRPANQLYDVIELQDPHSNRIGQWLNETSNSRILQLSYSLDTEAREGPYQIIVSMGERNISHNFKVEKYVLPKYDVTLNISEEVLIGQEDVEAEVCAKYTYGQPVPGRVTVNVCRPINRYSSFGISLYDYDLMALWQMGGSCHTETKQADKTGCATFSFNMSIFTKMDEKLQDVLDIRAKVEEEGTGVSLPQEKRVTISYVLGKVSFINVPKIWERGSNVEGKVRAVYHNNTPVCDAPVYLFTGQLWQPRSLQNLTTDSNGVASFSFSTDNFDGDIQLHASLTPTLGYPGYRTAHYDRGFHTLSMFQPSSPEIKTISSLEVQKKDKPVPCDAEEDISVNYTIVGESPGSLDVIYLVLSRGAVIMQGQTQVQVQDRSVTEGQVNFQFRVSPEMAPEFQLVAYAVLPSEDVIAHSADFSTDKCFSNKVSVEFSPSSAVPGEETNMQVTALPRSLCGVSAIDKSVLIKEPGKTLDADKIFDLLPLKKSSGIPYEVRDAEECLNVRPKRYVLPYPSQEQNDAYAVFQKVGLKMATNLIFRLPSCLKFKGKFYHDGPHVAYAIALDYGPPVRDDPIRGLSSPGLGSAVQLPPPIETARSFFPETWIWDLVEVGDDGKRGVSLTVPDTITTWETEAFCLSSQGFGLAPRKEMKVFQPFLIELTMPYSIIRGEHFELKATVFNYLTSCIMVTVTPGPSSDYTLTPLSGDLYTSCLCANERKTLRWTMIPTALGDILGRALKNLDGLLQMPHGCGEQNMALLAPNIYILHYLKGTQQLTTAIMEKATNFLTSGKLTAFVVRSFAKAQSFIYIDPRTIEESKTWLEHKQQETGCFEKSGKLFNNRMKGGVSDEVTLSAYVTAAFLEMNTSQHDPVMKKSLACLKQSISDLSNTYTTALLAYVFTLAGDVETRAHLLQHLDRVAVREGGFLYWSQTAAEKSASLSVEISSYVLLAKLSVSPTAEDLAYASGIMRWLTGQQNYYGGFSSTQVRRELMRINGKKAAGPDSISSRVVRSCADQLCGVMEHLFNLSLRLGRVPQLWKTSCVVPVSKTSRPKDLNSYRLVALTSHLMKTLERLVLAQLRRLVSSSLDPLRFAYQPGIGADDAVIHLLHRSLSHLETAGSTVRIMFFDFSSAFNTILPSVLKDKLENSGVDHHLTTWILDYLTDRPQYDTVVALQALCSTLVFSPEGWSTGTVQAPSSQLTFDVNQGNKLLYQEEALQDVSGKYRLEVKGTACASVQVSDSIM